jgi:hypothetical protein
MAAPWTSHLVRCIAATLLLMLAASSQSSETPQPDPDPKVVRKEVSVGYSLLYQQADAVPKLKWVLMFKDRPEDMGRIVNDLLGYYAKLAGTMERLSKQYPAMRIDVAAMSEIETATRKAMVEDLTKDMAPIVGQSGVKFEREALLAFYDLLNEQRHLVGVMVGLETNPTLKKFLQATKRQLEARYAEVGALLNRRYFTQ